MITIMITITIMIMITIMITIMIMITIKSHNDYFDISYRSFNASSYFLRLLR